MFRKRYLITAFCCGSRRMAKKIVSPSPLILWVVASGFATAFACSSEPGSDPENKPEGSVGGGGAGGGPEQSDKELGPGGKTGGSGDQGAGGSMEPNWGSSGAGSGGSGGRDVGGGGSQLSGTGGRGKAGGATGGGGSGGPPDGGSSGGSGGLSQCDGATGNYKATMIKSGSTWTVTSGGSQKYSGADTTEALKAAYNSLSSGRTTKEGILIQGDGDIPATAQVSMPSYTIVNWCGTLNISGSSSGDKSPFYARNKTDVEIANLKMTGSPSYGIFFRGTNNMVLGNIDLQLSGGSPGIAIRVDTSGSAGTDTTFVKNLTINHVTGGGMSSQLIETYGVDGIKIGSVEGDGVGECGLLLNRSINAEVDSVRCTNCGTGTGYAAFRVANSVGKIGDDWPADNIHVKSVYARGGGRGIFSVSGCGGLTIDTIDIANTGNTSILLQNTINTTIAAVSGTVVGGLVQISNDTANTESGRYAPSKNVAIKNLVLSGGASVRQDWCAQYGANGCSATQVTGGTVSMCP